MTPLLIVTPPSSVRRVGPVSAALATAAVFSGVLWVQHAREAWPFAPGSEPAPSLSASAAPPAMGTSSTHDRVPVGVAAATIEELGIRLEVVGRQSLTEETRAVATVVPDESRISHVHTRVAGWVEQLDVNTTGEMVRAGQPLLRIFSQELLSSQTEYLAVRKNVAASGITSVVVASWSFIMRRPTPDSTRTPPTIGGNGILSRSCLVTSIGPRSTTFSVFV